MASVAPANAQRPGSASPDVLLSEGQSLYETGRYKEAAAQFERAMQTGVARPHEAALKVARSYTRLGNAKQALRWAEIATLLACAAPDAERDTARPLPASTQALNRDALNYRLEEAQWRTQRTGTPTGKCLSSGSSMTSTI